jgi:HlyD family secretion protein
MSSKKSFPLGLVISIVVIGAAAAGGWYYWSQKGEKAPEILTTAVSTGDVIQVVTASGDIQPMTSVEVSSQISGLIREVLVDFNSPVKAGDVLARIDPATYDQRLKQAQADYASTAASTKLAKLNTDRTRELAKQSLVTQQEVDQAEAQLAQANAQLLTRQASVEDAKVNLSRCTIYAPINGLVMQRAADVGKTVAASLNAPTLFIIANDLARMQISAAVAEADVGNIEVGQPVTFGVDAYPLRQFKGVVKQIRNYPKTAQNVVTYETMIEVSNDDLKLKPGMTANVSIIVAQRRGTLKITNNALRVRPPEELLVQKKGEAKEGAKKDAPKAVSEEDRRRISREIMREVGYSREMGPMPAEMQAKATLLAKEKGIEIDFSRMGGGRGAQGGGPGASAPVGAPITRTIYRLISTNPAKPELEAVQVKLGISDGMATEIIEGVNEGDLIVTSVVMPNAKGAASGAANPANPFSGRTGGTRR